MILAVLTAVCSAGVGYAQTEVPDSISNNDYQELEEFTIEVQKPVLQSNGAVTTYNVQEDASADSSSALDILRKVPMVSVDGDGNVKLNGQSNFKFQVDGMENPMLQQYAGQILNAMPASMIVKIEVITEPGAKEDAEGSAGIINIITQRKQSSDGYSGNVGMKASTRDFGPSVYGILKKDKVTVSANVDYQKSYTPQKGGADSSIEYLTGQKGSLLSSFSQHTYYQYVGGNLNLSWEPNEKNLFTLGANIFNLDAGLHHIKSTTERYDDSGSLLWKFGQTGAGQFDVMSVSANGSFRHNFAEAGNYLVMSYLMNFGNNDIDYNLTLGEEDSYATSTPYEERKNHGYNRSHTAQIDYANDFRSEHHLMEVGAKGIFRRNSANSLYFVGVDAAGLTGTPIVSNLKQPQDIYALYGSYTGKFNALTVLGGLRYEHTRMGVTDMSDPSKSFANHLNDWVPNAAVTWQFENASNLRAAYQMRISRPSLDQINPFEIAFSPYEVRKGNPDLESEKSHKVSLTYTNFGSVIGGNIGVEYTYVNNAISSFTYLLNGANDVLVTSYANIGKTNKAALTGFLTWTIIRNMSLMVNGRLEYTKLEAPGLGYSNRGWGGNVGGLWNYTVEKVNKFNAFGGYMARSVNVQGHNSGFYYYGISASRDFLADKSLTLGLTASNFFQKKITFSNYARTNETISQMQGTNMPYWNVGVSITWKFGSLNTQVKKTGVEIKNDDINTTSNQNEVSPRM